VLKAAHEIQTAALCSRRFFYLFVQMLKRHFRFFHRGSLGLTIIDSRRNRQAVRNQLNSAAKSR
jgi:hypothetical protein